jgi:metal-responsive CopG/Arc/MetJ family transcriptional regulator
VPEKNHPDKVKSGGISVSIDPEMNEWLERYQKKLGLRSRSAAIHNCLTIAKNVIEKGDDREKVKFLLGEIPK